MSSQTLPPNGESLLPILWRQDTPTSYVLKYTMVLATIVGLMVYPLLPSFLISAGLDGNWDIDRGVIAIELDPLTGDETNPSLVFLLIEKTMGIPPNVSRNILIITIGCYAALIAADRYSDRRKHKEIWPKRWEVENMLCYHDMFTEPTRWGKLLRRPGNTLSNFMYFYGSLCILLSVMWESCLGPRPGIENTFLLADGLYGTMLLILSIASVIWHGSNAPNSHYVDLWAMDSCIIFLIIRVISLGFACYFIQNLAMDISTARNLSGWICAGLYVSFIIFNGRCYYRLWKSRWLHGHCPFSTRARLSGKSNMFDKGHVPIDISVVCLFLSLPISSSIPIAFVEYTFVGSVGSILAQKLAQYSFIIGWNYRLLDKFALDGCVPMNIVCRWNPSVLRTCLAAVISPTSVLHVWTGITLLTAYIHARSVELSAF